MLRLCTYTGLAQRLSLEVPRTTLLGISMHKGKKSTDRCLSSPKPPQRLPSQPIKHVPAHQQHRPHYYQHHRPANAAQTDTAPTKTYDELEEYC